MNVFTWGNGGLTAGILVSAVDSEAYIIALADQYQRRSLRELLSVNDENAYYSRTGLGYPVLQNVILPHSGTDVFLLVEKDVDSDVIEFVCQPLPQLLTSYTAVGPGYSKLCMLYRLNEGAGFRVMRRHKKSTRFNLVSEVVCSKGTLEVIEPQVNGLFTWLRF